MVLKLALLRKAVEVNRSRGRIAGGSPLHLQLGIAAAAGNPLALAKLEELKLTRARPWALLGIIEANVKKPRGSAAATAEDQLKTGGPVASNLKVLEKVT